MKKNFKAYSLIWVILLAVFNAVVFIVRSKVSGNVNDGAPFWIAWAFILAAFFGNLACACFAFRAENLGKMFYNLPLITVSRAAFVIMLVVGCAIMLIPACPAWIAAVLCIIVLAFNVIAVIKAAWAGTAVSDVDGKIKAQTAFVKTATVDAENLINRAKDDTARAECKKVYDALRYSDPVSSPELSQIEARISAKMEELATAVGGDDNERLAGVAGEIEALVKERNNKCRALK